MKIGLLLSGGVDSAVAGYLLKEQSHEVLAITMANVEYGNLEAARESAAELGLTHHIIDLKEAFQEKVADYFCQAYAQGKTPNPCTVCNRYIKFGAMLDYAKLLGCEKIATGHYANLAYNPQTGRYQLSKSSDVKKDQSYFLYNLSQEQLAYTLFPLGSITKETVKSIAGQQGFKVLNQDESQEICFVNDDYRLFLEGKVTSIPGAIVDVSGNYIGCHNGIAHYTVGQRKGLGISWKHPLYVLDLDPVGNTITVGRENQLYHKVLWSAENNFVSVPALEKPVMVRARIRYRAKEDAAYVIPENDLLRVEFIQPQRAITKGQCVVYYDGDVVLGGGVIIESGV